MISFFPILLVVLAILIAGVILAENAGPLGSHPYRWGLFLGIATAGWSVFLLPATVSSLARKDVIEAVVMVVWVLCGIGAAAGVVKRRRFGIVLSLAFYIQLVLWPAVFMTLRGIPQEEQRSFATPVAILIVTNYIYFSKRWEMLS